MVQTSTPGTFADRYRILEDVGRGAHSRVVRAVQIGVEREVALKLLTPPEHDEDNLAERVLREARIIAGVHHPGLVQIYDCGEHQGVVFIAMELLRGQTLEARLRKGPMPYERVVALGRDMASALQAVHEKGYIHRDIKPSNIFLEHSDDGSIRVRIIDFGLVRRISLEEADGPELDKTLLGVGDLKSLRTLKGMIFGTPSYMSPEQAMGKPTGARSDLYALGCVMYEMLTGVPPFAEVDRSVSATMAAHIALPPEPIQLRAPTAGVPNWLDDAVMRLLAKAPADRFDSAAALIAALDAQEAPPPVPNPESPTWPPAPPQAGTVAQPETQRSRRTIAAVVLALGLLMTSLIALWPRGEPRHAAVATQPTAQAALPKATATAFEAPNDSAGASPQPRRKTSGGTARPQPSFVKQPPPAQPTPVPAQPDSSPSYELPELKPYE